MERMDASSQQKESEAKSEEKAKTHVKCCKNGS